MTPRELQLELDLLIKHNIMDPVLIIGESGIGKTEIVNTIFAKRSMGVWDVRWGQLAPVDARGVPVIDREKKLTEFYPPSFWPRTGPGCIFLDEFNMAGSAMMGLGQQLLNDRRFGDYRVPPDIFVWAAGNRKIDRAAVNDIPAPVNNRMAHYEVHPDFQSWETWAYAEGIDARIVGFLKFRTELLHKFLPDNPSPAWPSPRTWEMADRRLKVGMSIGPVVGGAVAEDFDSYIAMVAELPKIELIAQGRGNHIDMPDEPSLKYAVMSGLTRYALNDVDTFTKCFEWFTTHCIKEPEWVQMYVMDVIRIISENSEKRKKLAYLTALDRLPGATRFLEAFYAK